MTIQKLVFFLSFLIPSSLAKRRVKPNPRHCRGSVKHIHLAVGRDPSQEMTVSFASIWSVPETIPPIGGVHIGLKPELLDRFVPEHEIPIQYNSTIPGMDERRLYYSPYQHHITIKGLEPNTTYYYVAVTGSRKNGINGLASKPLRRQHSVENQTETGEENIERSIRHRRLAPSPYDGSDRPCVDNYRIRSFTTAPENIDCSTTTTTSTPLEFAILGDLGQFQHSKETLEHMKKYRNGINAAIVVGDIAYTVSSYGSYFFFGGGGVRKENRRNSPIVFFCFCNILLGL